MKIIDIRPDWNDEFDNVPDFQVRVDSKPEFGPYDERRRLFVAQAGPLLNFFYWAGKPDQGFGGWRRTIALKAGGSLEVIGGWSSGVSSVSSVYPELLCVGASYTDRPWGEYVQMSCGLLTESLVDWYLDHRHEVDWGLYLFNPRHGPVVVPSKGRFVKAMDGQGSYLARLLPWKREMPQYRQQHRDYFLGAVREAWAKVQPHVDDVSTEQRAAINA